MDRDSIVKHDDKSWLQRIARGTQVSRVRFSLRCLVIFVVGVCAASAVVGFEAKRCANERSAVLVLRSKYDATVNIPNLEGPDGVDDAPIWSWQELVHGRLYVPNTYCSVGYYADRPFDATFLTALSKLHYIQTLHVNFKSRSPQCRLEFGHFRELKELDVSGMTIYVNEIESLRAVHGLDILKMTDSGITNDHLVRVGQLTSIKQLNIANNLAVDDRGLASLGNLVSLTSLAASGTSIRGDCFASLTSWKSLESLTLIKTELDDARVIALCNYFPNLKVLAVGGPHVTDACMGALAQHERLEVLFVRAPMVTDDGVRKLRKSKRLYRVLLRDTNTTNASVEIIEELAKKNGWRCNSF